jgi:hypothetical protein
VAEASTGVAMAEAASMADPPMADITGVALAAAAATVAAAIAARCMGAAAMEIPALDALGRPRDAACEIRRRDSIPLRDQETARACRDLAAEPWLPLAGPAWARPTSRASLTGISILSVASTQLDFQGTRQSTTRLWERAA